MQKHSFSRERLLTQQLAILAESVIQQSRLIDRTAVAAALVDVADDLINLIDLVNTK